MRASRHPLALAILCTASSLAFGAGETKGTTYRWVDDNGVVHYGDRLPAQQAPRESSVLNKQGVEIRHNDAQKTPEQLVDEKRKQEALLKQKQHDAFLLTTYTSVKDIEALRDERLGQISGQRRAAEAYIEGLHARLNNLQGRAKNFKPYNDKPDARRMPDELAEDLVRTMNEMRSQKNALTAKDAEETALRAEFQSDIERYRELHKVVSNR